MNPNGIILINDYSAVTRATKAIDEFLKSNKQLKIKKLSYYKISCYIVVP